MGFVNFIISRAAAYLFAIVVMFYAFVYWKADGKPSINSTNALTSKQANTRRCFISAYHNTGFHDAAFFGYNLVLVWVSLTQGDNALPIWTVAGLIDGDFEFSTAGKESCLVFSKTRTFARSK